MTLTENESTLVRVGLADVTMVFVTVYVASAVPPVSQQDAVDAP
jgi:hypothetical protein